MDRLWNGTLTAVRALLAGDRLLDPAAGARPLRLGVVPEDPVPIELAALAPASVRLAGEAGGRMDTVPVDAVALAGGTSARA